MVKERIWDQNWTRHVEIRLEICLDFKIEFQQYKNQVFTKNGVSIITSKNTILNGYPFAKSKVTISFRVLKQGLKWSRFCPGLLYKKNETSLTVSLILVKSDFWQTSPKLGILYIKITRTKGGITWYQPWIQVISRLENVILMLIDAEVGSGQWQWRFGLAQKMLRRINVFSPHVRRLILSVATSWTFSLQILLALGI